MSDIAIRVENLSKLYHIGRARRRHDTLRDAIADFRWPILDFGKRNPKSSGRGEIHGRVGPCWKRAPASTLN